MLKNTKGQRLPEQVFRIVMWGIAVLFAGFLIGLGSLVIGDLPRAGQAPSMAQFESAELKQLREGQGSLAKQNDALSRRLEQAHLSEEVAQNRYDEEKQSFDAWIQTRTATNSNAQNPEVLSRTKKLDALRESVRKTKQTAEAISKETLDNNQSVSQERITELSQQASERLETAQNKYDLTVFFWRLLLTLPMLLIAIWLFLKKRHTRYWPFVWGFIFFALFAFFVELVPYLPSYGGYVRYVVGIVLLGVGGHYGIKQMQTYLQRKQEQEQEMLQSSQEERRQAFTYEQALGHLARSVCPSCERVLSSSEPNALADYCIHCGLCVYRNCKRCNTRCSTFYKFCSSCGDDLHDGSPV